MLHLSIVVRVASLQYYLSETTKTYFIQSGRNRSTSTQPHGKLGICTSIESLPQDRQSTSIQIPAKQLSAYDLNSQINH